MMRKYKFHAGFFLFRIDENWTELFMRVHGNVRSLF